MRMATELTRHANQLHEIQLELQRLATTTSQAEERATVAEEKACAAVTAIGMVKAPEQKKTKLNNRDAEKFWPETYTADRADKKSFAEFLGEVETFLSVLAPGLLARPLLEWAAAFRDQPIVLSDVEAYEAAYGNPFDWNLKEVSEALGPLLHKVCKGSAGVKLKAVLKIDGFNAWRVLAFWFQARSTNDSMSLLTMIMNPDRAKDLNDMMNKLDRWDALIRDYEMKFEKDDISDKMRQAALFAMAPEAVVENRLAGRRDLDNYAKVRCMIDDMIRDKREARGAIKLSGGGNQPPPDVDQLKLREMTSDFAEESSEGGSDTSSVQKLAESLSAFVESLNSASKGKGKGKGKKGQWAQDSSTGGQWQGTSQNVAGNRQPWPQPKEAGRAIEKPKGKGKGKGKSGGKAKGKGKGLKCYVCGGIGHPARLCPSEGWVNDLEQDTPVGEDTNEEGCWTEEDDETLQLGYLGSESCSMSSPPGLCDAFSEAGWTVVTRKSRNRQQCSRRRGCSDKLGTVLGSLWDDDNDMILGQVADDRTRKGMVKISAVVDSGAEANALPENMMQWIPLKPSSASKSGKIFRGAGGDPIPARGERSVTGRTEEGQSRRIVWEVCPVKRPLLSVAKITKAGNQVYLGEDKAFVKNNKTGQITNLRRERNVWMLDLWVKRPADAMDVSSFQRLGR